MLIEIILRLIISSCCFICVVAFILIICISVQAADTDLPIRAGIWNLDTEPIHALAFSECARPRFPCSVQCAEAPIDDVVNACVAYELCCVRAGPYLDTPFGETVEE